ncbi:MAG: hypothetical protein ACLQQ4_09540 [Bacteroidia bacterium]
MGLLNIKKEKYPAFVAEFKKQLSQKYPGIPSSDVDFIYDELHEEINSIRTKGKASSMKDYVATLAATVAMGLR